MALQTGARLGPYEILSLIGAGGMGEVYRARDTKLHRDIAIKVLADRVARDPDRLARFMREAQTLAALNHPNIAHIHGIEDTGPVRALVMELVEGEDLAQRLARGPIPVDEALPIARQIAEALEAAHEHGIVHRDLKPANIRIREDGTVKVLDFGLAKALIGDFGGQTSAAEALRNSPTFTSPAMTEIGVILGTAGYMAPEQAKGRPTDRRSDIWAFGCVLYEMLTGARAFEGDDVSDTMANVLKLEPDWNRLPDATPPAVRGLLRRCLRKEKRQRFHDAADVRIEIEDALLGAPVGGAPAVSARRGRATLWQLAWVAGVASVGAAIIGGFAGWNLKPPSRSAPRAVARLAVSVPADEELDTGFPALALSPDGAHLVYVAKRGEIYRLHLRSIDSLESTTLLGTEGAAVPFFSPDSRWIGFFADGKLKRIPVTGGASQIVCDAPEPFGGSWAPNDTIYFAPGSFSGLWRVSATGGTPQPFTTLQGAEIGHRWPQVLPSGQGVLFTSRTGPGADEHQVQVQRVSDGERRVLAQGDTGYYVPTGHLVYVQTVTGTLAAVAFDPTHLRVGSAAPVAVAQGIRVGGQEGPHYTFSRNGLLAYLAGRADVARTLVWVDRRGKADPLYTPRRPYEFPRVSPDGEHVAFMTPGGKMEIWVHDLARGNAMRLLSEGSDQFPLWTPDGKRVTYRATRAGTRNIFWRMADGTGTEERLTTGLGSQWPNSWSPDGQVLLFSAQSPVRLAGPDVTGGADIFAFRLADHTSQPFVHTRFFESEAQFSPDGRWVAYRSDESGRGEIYVLPFSGSGRKWQVSAEGGTEPVWNPNGGELFYRSGNKMMAVNIATRPVFAAGRPTLLFTGDYMVGSTSHQNYDVSPDGQRFLMVQPSVHEPATPNQITVVLNWFEELKRLVPTQ